ncbi:MAG: hypothetical protein WDZ28_05135 [Simkaniaceae bacterium]
MRNRTIITAIITLFISGISAQEKQIEPAPSTDKDVQVKITDRFVKNHFGYVDLGVGPLPLPLPQFGAGYRSQFQRLGADVHVSALPLLTHATVLKGSFNLLYYFKPDLEKQYYVGIGPEVGAYFEHEKWSFKAIDSHRGFYIAPNLTLGKEYTSDTGARRFLQTAIVFPAYWNSEKRYKKGKEGRVATYPFVTISYGWGF